MDDTVFVSGLVAFGSIAAIVVLAVVAGAIMIVCENIAGARRAESH